MMKLDAREDGSKFPTVLAGQDLTASKMHAHRGGSKDQRCRVFSGVAASGAPCSLCRNESKRKLIQGILEGFEIKSFGLTSFLEIPGHRHIGPEFEALEGYENWFEYAVKSNSHQTKVFIAVSIYKAALRNFPREATYS